MNGLNGAVHHGVVHLIIGLAHGGVGYQTEDTIALYHTVVDTGSSVVQQQRSIGTLLLLEGYQHVVELVVVGLGAVQAQLIQPILADHGAEGLGGLGLHTQLGIPASQPLSVRASGTASGYSSMSLQI